ncbi:MAG: hypothetical protein SPJ34_00705 [Candidatus Ornithospirochaeta sp.]|nr:hypothetical protein [Candidatus Ornithospirochaeta sp.]
MLSGSQRRWKKEAGGSGGRGSAFLPLIMPVLFLQPDGVLSLFRR